MTTTQQERSEARERFDAINDLGGFETLQEDGHVRPNWPKIFSWVDEYYIERKEFREMIENEQDNILGLIVKNSTGFDTDGSGRRLWHLDIDVFSNELKVRLSDLLKRL